MPIGLTDFKGYVFNSSKALMELAKKEPDKHLVYAYRMITAKNSRVEYLKTNPNLTAKKLTNLNSRENKFANYLTEINNISNEKNIPLNFGSTQTVVTYLPSDEPESSK